MISNNCGILTSADSDEPVQPHLSLELQMMFSQYMELNIHRIFKRLAMALISLRVCAGWSETLLGAHTTLLEISCCGSYVLTFCIAVAQIIRSSVEATIANLCNRHEWWITDRLFYWASKLTAFQ